MGWVDIGMMVADGSVREYLSRYVDICGTRSVRGEGHRYSGTGRVSWEVAELYETRSVREKGHM